MSGGYDQDRGVTVEQLAALVAAIGRPPMVTAYEVVPGELGGIASGATTRRRLFGVNAQLMVVTNDVYEGY